MPVTDATLDSPRSLPTLECDLIMKGGITSGVVYPPAVLELKEKFRFRSIGGTSAGAIAAALTAAAEFGRSRGGFEALADASKELGQSGFLLGLFRPTGGTGPLFSFLLRLMDGLKGERGPLRIVTTLHRALLRAAPLSYGLGVVCSAAIGLALTAGTAAYFRPKALAEALPQHGILAIFTLPGLWALLAVLLALAGVALLAPLPGLLYLAGIVGKRVPANHLGLCRGTGTSGAPALIEWLHASLQRCAGRSVTEPPLTFGELWHGPADMAPGTEAQPAIDLRMVTSCLSLGQPFVLPFAREVFAFRIADFEQFFPPGIVAVLRARAPAVRAGIELPPGYCFLPEGGDLPVLVAIRMSLSFPLLFSAIPLYSVPYDYATAEPSAAPRRIGERELQLTWFSDGGICSNFPIHFFDRWLPRRPTFGISLTSLPAEGFVPGRGTVRQGYVALSRAPVSGGAGTPGPSRDRLFYNAVYLPRAGDEQAPEWVPLGDPADPVNHPSLMKFLGAIFSTAQNYRDNTQSLLPSYRERVVQIRLRNDEGGLNLAMDAKTIQGIVTKGEQAGAVLRGDFNFPEHRWVRLRVLLAELERNLLGMRGVIEAERSFWLDELGPTQWGADEQQRFAYARPEEWFREAVVRLESLLDVASTWSEAPLLEQTPPEPRAELRVMPPA